MTEQDVEREYQHLNFGDTIEVIHLGIWGHEAFTNTYTFSGASGHYPDTHYRFTMIGDCSIKHGCYNDVYFMADQCYEGFSTSLHKIKSVTRSTSNKHEKALAVAREALERVTWCYKSI